MKTTAIICEYNPFTNGHLEHIRRAREETNSNTIICIMSGSFTQRGDAAIADKYQRATIAVRLGCDMVVELPTIFAVSPADNFAYGAIKTISSLPNVRYISFGSECGNIEKLTRMAILLSDEPQELKELLSINLKSGLSFPKARAKAINEYVESKEELNDLKNIIDFPNNVLGISYIIAAIKFNLSIKFHTIKRIGSNYNDNNITNKYPSASAIREAMKEKKLSEYRDCIPPYTYNLLENYNNNGTSLGDLILFKMKEIDGLELEKYYDVNEGLHNRLKLAAIKANNYEQFIENAKTKRYTMAKLKRISIYVLLGITKELYNSAIETDPYIFILAMNRNRKDILSEMNKKTKNVLVRYSNIEKVDKSLRPLIKLDFKAQGILEIINRSNYFRNSMILL